MEDKQKPDTFERWIRFGCGWIFGALVAVYFLRPAGAEASGWVWTMVLGVALVFGWLAMRYGDEFWHGVLGWLGRWLRWWW